MSSLQTKAVAPCAAPAAASSADAAEDESSTAVRAADPDAETANSETSDPDKRGARRTSWRHTLAFGVLPTVALISTMGAAYFKWVEESVRDSHAAQGESVRAATDSTIAILSYHRETVEGELAAAQERLTGKFKDAYTSLTHDVVIPSAKEKHISAVASVPAAASVSADPGQAVVLVFVDQVVTIGNDPPTSTASSVRVTLDIVDGRWLISAFDPV